MDKAITVAGNLIVDSVKTIDSYPDAGLLCNIGEVSRCIGGCAANTAADLKILDPSLRVNCIGRTGDDENGDYITGTLAALGVDVRGVRRSKECPTSFTDVMTIRHNGIRTFFHARGANAQFGIEDIDFAALNPGIFHIGYALLLDRFDAPDADYGTVMARALHEATVAGLKTSMDVVSEAGDRFERIVTPSLRHCDYLIVNEVEGSAVTGLPVRGIDGRMDKAAVFAVCERLLALGVRELAVIHSPEGGWAVGRDGEAVAVPSLTLPKDYIKGSVGAGDAFAAGMLYAIDKGIALREALTLACAAAAANLSHSDSIHGMVSVNELNKLDRRFRSARRYRTSDFEEVEC